MENGRTAGMLGGVAGLLALVARYGKPASKIAYYWLSGPARIPSMERRLTFLEENALKHAEMTVKIANSVKNIEAALSQLNRELDRNASSRER